MIDARMMRDVSIALALALPTLALTRPVGAEPLGPSARHSSVVAEANIATMSSNERRTTIPSR